MPSDPQWTPDRYRGAELAFPPGVALMITGSLSLLMALGNAGIFVVISLTDPNANGEPEGFIVVVVMLLLMTLIGGAIAGLIFAGGNSLRKCGSYGLSMTGAVVAVGSVIFGCPCTPLGLSGMGMACINLPVGIWALVVLSNMDVREAFRH